jgi:hypothetical protein
MDPERDPDDAGEVGRRRPVGFMMALTKRSFFCFI